LTERGYFYIFNDRIDRLKTQFARTFIPVDYLKAAMRRVKYEMIDDPHPFYGEIPELPGVWANAATLEACRDELEEVVEGWIILSLQRGYTIPAFNNHRSFNSLKGKQ